MCIPISKTSLVLGFINIPEKIPNQLSNMFQVVPVHMLMFLLRNSSYAHWQWTHRYDFQCVPQQMVHFISHGTSTELSWREIKAKQGSRSKHYTSTVLGTTCLKGTFFFPQSSGQQSTIKLLHSEFLCTLSLSWKSLYHSFLLTILHWFKCKVLLGCHCKEVFIPFRKKLHSIASYSFAFRIKHLYYAIYNSKYYFTWV